jgi:hypothetical protein
VRALPATGSYTGEALVPTLGVKRPSLLSPSECRFTRFTVVSEIVVVLLNNNRKRPHVFHESNVKTFETDVFEAV